MVGALVLAHGTVGKIDASTTRRPSNAPDPALIICHRHRVIIPTHAAGARCVPSAGGVRDHELIKRFIISQQVL